MNFLRKHMRVIFAVTILGFFAGTFVGLGSLFAADDSASVVTVNKSKISAKLFNSIYSNTVNAIRQNLGRDLTADQLAEVKARTVEALVQDEIFYQESQKYQIVVSDEELRSDIVNTPMFRGDGNAFNQEIYNNFLGAINLSAKEYETLRKKQIASQKLRILLVPSIKISASEFSEVARVNPKLDINTYAQVKINKILNEWYTSIVRTSKIVTNEEILNN